MFLQDQSRRRLPDDLEKQAYEGLAWTDTSAVASSVDRAYAAPLPGFV